MPSQSIKQVCKLVPLDTLIFDSSLWSRRPLVRSDEIQATTYQDAGIEEDKRDDEPEHGLRFDCPPTRTSRSPIELVEGFLLLLPERVRLDDDALVAHLVLRFAGQFGCNRNWNLEFCSISFVRKSWKMYRTDGASCWISSQVKDQRGENQFTKDWKM